MELRLFIALFGILFIGLLGIYALVIKYMKDTTERLGKIYETVNGHVQDTSVHVDPEHPFRTIEVCEEREKTTEVHFDALSSGQQRIEKNMQLLVEKLL